MVCVCMCVEYKYELKPLTFLSKTNAATIINARQLETIFLNLGKHTISNNHVHTPNVSHSEILFLILEEKSLKCDINKCPVSIAQPIKPLLQMGTNVKTASEAVATEQNKLKHNLAVKINSDVTRNANHSRMQPKS